MLLLQSTRAFWFIRPFMSRGASLSTKRIRPLQLHVLNLEPSDRESLQDDRKQNIEASRAGLDRRRPFLNSSLE